MVEGLAHSSRPALLPRHHRVQRLNVVRRAATPASVRHEQQLRHLRRQLPLLSLRICWHHQCGQWPGAHRHQRHCPEVLLPPRPIFQQESGSKHVPALRCPPLFAPQRVSLPQFVRQRASNSSRPRRQRPHHDAASGRRREPEHGYTHHVTNRVSVASVPRNFQASLSHAQQALPSLKWQSSWLQRAHGARLNSTAAAPAPR